MNATTTAAETASPWYQDKRTSDQRFCAIAAYFDEVGLSEGARLMLRCQELHPWDKTDDPAPFDNYFQSFDGLIAPFVVMWLAEDSKDTASRFPAVQELLRDIKDCEYALAAVSLVAQEPESHCGSREDKAECIAKVDRVRAIATRLQSQLQDMTTTPPFAEAYRRDQACHTTSVVFVLPELAEHVLKFVDNDDILRLQEVSRTFNRIIEGSSTLQRRLGLRPDVNGHHVLPLETPYSMSHCRGHPGFNCSSRATVSKFSNALRNLRRLKELCDESQPPADLADFKVKASLEVTDGKLPSIGSRYRAMLLCQPPITKVTMRLSYIYDSRRRGPEEVEMELYHREEDGTIFEDAAVFQRRRAGIEPTAPTVVAEGPGLTLGQLWDAAGTLLRDQKQLNYEMCRQYNPGAVTAKWPFTKKVIVHFEGTLRLRYDDPAIAPASHWSELEPMSMKEGEDLSKRSSAFRRIMQTDMSDRKHPTAQELQVAWSALREIVMSMEECELEDVETVSEEQLTSETEST
ncbi:hypothetical protein LTS10_006771 [Elasticomyces elasticus]|nr:hypothetical protein LTS10_006771 [Elasticomyces elasticus]